MFQLGIDISENWLQVKRYDTSKHSSA